MPATEGSITIDVAPMDLGENALPVYSIEDMGSLPPPRWLIRNFLEHHGLTLVFGREKTGKSTAVLNILLGWLTGAEPGGFGDEERFRFEDDPSEHKVLYCLLEGQNTVYYRAKAWADALGTGLPENLHMMGHSLSLFNSRVSLENQSTWTPDMVKLWNTISVLEPTVVVIDTFSRANPNLDENSPGVAAFVGFLDLLRDTFGVSFILVHHAPKREGSMEPRGHSSLPGAATTLVNFTRKNANDAGEGITMWVGRQRNGQDIGVLPYDLVFESAEYGDPERPIEVARMVRGEDRKDGTIKDQIVADLLPFEGGVEVKALVERYGTYAYQLVDELEEEGAVEVIKKNPKTVRMI